MMRFFTLLAGIILLANSVIFGQGFDQNLEFLEENTVPVKDKKTTYEQTFSSNPENHYLLSVSIVDTRKGEERIQSVNAMDLNPFLIKFEPDKEVVEITAEINGGKDLVKVVEDGEIQNYEDELMFYASGIEEARKLTEALKGIAEFANDNSDSLISVSKNETTLLNDLKNEITDVTINDDVYVQSFGFDESDNNIVTFTLSNSAGDEMEQYTLNVADLNPHKIDFTTKHEDVLIPLTTKGSRDLIAYTENGETGNYTDELELRAPSIEDARMLVAQLETLVSLAEKEETVDYSKFSYDECADILKEKIGEVVINQDAYEQEFKPDTENNLVFNYTIQDVSEGENTKYRANAADFGKIPVDFDTDGKSIFVELSTIGDRDLIMVTENDEDIDYDDEMKIRVPDIETAREVAGAFTRFNELAFDKLEEMNVFTNFEDAETYLTGAVDKVVVETDTYLQSMEKDDSDDCFWKFHQTDVSDDTRYDFEFNLKDVDVNKIQFETDGGEALVKIRIKGGNDLIKAYENGEVDKYTDSFEIKAKDLEQARKLETALKTLTEACGEK